MRFHCATVDELKGRALGGRVVDREDSKGGYKSTELMVLVVLPTVQVSGGAQHWHVADLAVVGPLHLGGWVSVSSCSSFGTPNLQ